MRQDYLQRSSLHGRHPVNALLDYRHAVLESQVRIAIAEVGLDPTLGYPHICQRDGKPWSTTLWSPTGRRWIGRYSDSSVRGRSRRGTS